MGLIAILVASGVFIGIYYFLANSEDLEWNRKTKRFENWKKGTEYSNLKWNSRTRKFEPKE